MNTEMLDGIFSSLMSEGTVHAYQLERCACHNAQVKLVQIDNAKHNVIFVTHITIVNAERWIWQLSEITI